MKQAEAVIVVGDALTDSKFLPNRLAERLASAKQRNRNVNYAAHVWLKY